MEALIERRAAAGAAERLVVALHCFGGAPQNWRALETRLGPGDRLLAPGLHGAPGGPRWRSGRPFRLADDASAAVAAIDAHRGPVHLAGHSLGGAVALRIAALRPERIGSMALYEPTPLHLLWLLGPSGQEAQREVAAVNRAILERIAAGELDAAAEASTDYWSGAGSWKRLRSEVRAELVRLLPQGQRVYRALFSVTTGPGHYRSFGFPVRLLCGGNSPGPAKVIASGLLHWLPDAELMSLEGLGHMGPLTHPELVAMLMRPF
jgi:pimeloyl-ACP methyl ester carboxylesterase